MPLRRTGGSSPWDVIAGINGSAVHHRSDFAGGLGLTIRNA